MNKDSSKSLVNYDTENHTENVCFQCEISIFRVIFSVIISVEKANQAIGRFYEYDLIVIL